MCGACGVVCVSVGVGEGGKFVHACVHVYANEVLLQENAGFIFISRHVWCVLAYKCMCI